MLNMYRDRWSINVLLEMYTRKKGTRFLLHSRLRSKVNSFQYKYIIRFILVTQWGMHVSFTSNIFALLALATYYRK